MGSENLGSKVQHQGSWTHRNVVSVKGFGTNRVKADQWFYLKGLGPLVQVRWFITHRKVVCVEGLCMNRVTADHQQIRLLCVSHLPTRCDQHHIERPVLRPGFILLLNLKSLESRYPIKSACCAVETSYTLRPN